MVNQSSTAEKFIKKQLEWLSALLLSSDIQGQTRTHTHTHTHTRTERESILGEVEGATELKQQHLRSASVCMTQTQPIQSNESSFIRRRAECMCPV